jgi:hypothetical protein
MIFRGILLIAALAALALGAARSANAAGASIGTPVDLTNGKARMPVLAWKPVEISFTAANHDANPYLHIPPKKQNDLLQVTFTGTSGAAKGQSMTLIGFWDGGQDWKVRFAPPAAGEWHYETHSSDPGLDKKSGDFVARESTADELKANPLGHGFIQVCHTGPRAGRYFQYADGTPFLWIGDTWWNWGSAKPPVAEFEKVVDDRAKKGFTVGQLYVHGWGHSVLSDGGTVLDLDRMKRLDAMIAYANARGIVVMISPWWGGKDLAEKIGTEKMERLTRYLMHRYGAYNVLWILASEYNLYNYGGLGLKFWEDYGDMMKREDPYARALSVHPTPPGWDGGRDAPQWSTAQVLQDQPWLDYNQSQAGHGKAVNEMVPSIVADSYAKKPAKPIVVTETWYEFVEGNAPARDIRFAAWSAILSGAAGHTYGGGHVWVAHTPESPAAPMPWPLDRGFDTNTLDYPGAVSMAHLAQFFTSIEWWRLEPHPELVLDYPQKFCAAIPGQEYVLYLRYGSGVTVDLSSTPKTDTFDFRWFNPATGEYSPGPTEPGGGRVHVGPPPIKGVDNLNQQDWVLHIRKAKPA